MCWRESRLQFLQQLSNSYKVALIYIKALDDPEGKDKAESPLFGLSAFFDFILFLSHYYR
jgi:hypothetical protein